MRENSARSAIGPDRFTLVPASAALREGAATACGRSRDSGESVRPRPSGQSSPLTPLGTPRPTLLVVEDDDDSRLALAAVLRQHGYGVVPAANGEEGLRALRSGPTPDLILLDMLMPGLDGWGFLGQLQQAGAQVPVLVTTGTEALTPEWAEAHGCAGLVRKPVEPDELLAEVRRCLG
jgi:CheY-like chemotaxis protein